MLIFKSAIKDGVYFALYGYSHQTGAIWSGDPNMVSTKWEKRQLRRTC
jgi:hypothetical protein